MYPCAKHPSFQKSHYQKDSRLRGFATWTIYGTLCIYFRNQGFAVILNRFFGTVINAAYGIATQVFSSTLFLSEAIVNAVRPQVVMAEGSGNRQLMLNLALKACKYCFLVSALCIIPLIFEIRPILHFWLGNIPPYAGIFCRILLLSVLCDQITIGLNIANTAIGKIRNFTLLVFTIKALSVPVFYYLLAHGESVKTAMLSFLACEILSGIIRVPYLMHNGGMKFRSFVSEVILRIVPSCLVMCAVCYASCHWLCLDLRFLVTGCLNVLFGIIAIFFISTTPQERRKITTLIIRK